MFVLDSVSCADAFPADGASGGAQIVAQNGSPGGYFTVTGNDAYVQLAYQAAPGASLEWTPAVHVGVGNGILAAGTRGIRFANYVAGSVAVVSAGLSEPLEPPLQLTSAGVSGGAVTLTIVTSLPSPATDGQEVLYKVPAGAGVPANGAYWHVKWIAAVSSWLVIGGTALRAMPGGSFAPTGTAYATVAGTPTIAIPNNGTYVVEWGYSGSYGNSTDVRAAPDGAGAVAANATSAWSGQHAGGTTGSTHSPATGMEFSLTPGTLGWKVLRTETNNGTGINPWMIVRPQWIT